MPPHAHPQHVGFVYTFSNPVFGGRTGGRGCSKCETEADKGTLCRAQIPLTAALLARAQIQPGASPNEGGAPVGIEPLPSLDRGTVDDYLGNFLHWNVMTVRHSSPLPPLKCPTAATRFEGTRANLRRSRVVRMSTSLMRTRSSRWQPTTVLPALMIVRRRSLTGCSRELRWASQVVLRPAVQPRHIGIWLPTQVSFQG